MTKRLYAILAPIIAVWLLAACMSPVLGQKTATLVLATAPASVSRALTGTWPMGGPPVFSDISIGVIDSDGRDAVMPRDPVVSGDTITVTVMAGDDLTLIIDATPDWDATATAYDTDLTGLPTLATTYSGRKRFSARAGETVSLTIGLATSGTKILLPNPNNDGSLGIADGIDSLDVSESTYSIYGSNSFTAYDKYGYLYISNGAFVSVYNALSQDPIEILDFSDTVVDIAVSESDNRLYGYYFGDGASLYYIDLDDEARTVISITDPSDSLVMDAGGVAADSAGYVYLPATRYFPDQSSVSGIFKVAIADSALEIVDSVSLSDLGLGYWYDDGDSGLVFYSYAIEDMTIVDDVLYLAVSDINSSPAQYDEALAGNAWCRGKIVAVDTAGLSKSWEAGWRSDAERRPESASGIALFAPRRFVALAPKKLYVVDDGFYYDSSLYNPSGTWYPFVDVNRIVEVDTSTTAEGAMRYGLSNLSEFFNDYDSISTYSNC